MSAKSADISWMIGGPQGSGVDSSATLFARAVTVGGFWTFGKREYHSNIKGKHSYFQLRVRPEPVRSNIDPVHLLATFEKSTAEIHGHEIVPDGALIYDPVSTNPAELEMERSVQTFAVPYDEMIKEMAEETNQPIAKLTIMKNTISVAASLALLGLEMGVLEEAFAGLFSGKKSKLIPLNMLAAKKSYDLIQKLDGFGAFPYKLETPASKPAKGSRMVMNGAAACALGKLKAGCRLQTYYSITPAVDECIFLEQHPEYGIIVFQAEDELAAINMTASAGTTGIRTSTATSGPGFCLMTEGIGWAAINEVPMVVFNYQRGGPSTGLPTRNEQGDLLFSIFGGHGDVPKIVLAPGDMNECFEDSFYAFNYADRYQTPVTVIPDKQMANSTQTLQKFNDNGMVIDRGQMVGPPADFDPKQIETGVQKFARFKITEDGVSPRSVPGTPGRIFWLTGDEHTEYGNITEKPEIRIPMHEKRMKKLLLAAKEIPQDRQYNLYGPEDAPFTLVSWGSTKGAVLDAMEVLKKEHNVDINFLHIRLMSPFPSEAVGKILRKAKTVACMESNYTAQLGQLITMRTAFKIPHNILKWTGRPISETEVVAAVLDVNKNKTERVVLTYGH